MDDWLPELSPKLNWYDLMVVAGLNPPALNRTTRGAVPDDGEADSPLQL